MKKKKSKALIVEDEIRMRRVLIMLLSDFDLEFIEAEDGLQAKEAFDEGRFDLIITDIKLPKSNGMEVLLHVKENDPDLPVIVITAFGSIDNAVTAIRHGAFDYVTKPFKEERLRECVKKALQISRLTSEVRHLRQEVEGKYNFDNIIGNSPQICKVLQLAGDVARTDTSVLITGESGTGKELLSRAIHYNSHRSDGPFLPINCAAIPSTLLESELFGYEKGAFTGADRRQRGKFEMASGGTLFLDEIGDMGMQVQAKLLRILEGQQFERLGSSKPIQTDVRIIAATNRNLKNMVEEKQFRNDLYFRINVFPIQIPPLREHRDDIPLLCNYFIHQFSQALGRKVPQLTQPAQDDLMQHHWGGNIRELKNVIERAMILCRGSQITSRHLILHESPKARFDEMSIDQIVSFLIGDNGIDLEDLEHRLVVEAMHVTKQNVSKAARLLRLTRATLRYRLEKMSSRSVY
jgi:DNA-binding NtrC family response regulator